MVDSINTIKFSEMIAGGDIAPNNQTPGLLGATNVLFNNPWTFLAPGTTAERPIPTAAMYYRLRLNTILELYEYYDPTAAAWIQLLNTDTSPVNPGLANDMAFYAAAGQEISPIAGAANSVLVTDALKVPSLSTTLPTDLTIPTPKMLQINDLNGNPLLGFSATALAVNYLSIINAPAGGQPQLNSVGPDADISLSIVPKGLGRTQLFSTRTDPLWFVSGTGYQHYTIFDFANTASAQTVTFPDATGTLLMTGQAISTVPSIAFSSTTGVVGTTTNDSAAAGSVGEFLSNSTSGTALTSGIVAQVASIALAGGDYDVWGVVVFGAAPTTVTTDLCASVSDTTVTLSASRFQMSGLALSAGATNLIPAPTVRISIPNGGGTAYLNCFAGFVTSTMTSDATIYARRVR